MAREGRCNILISLTIYSTIIIVCASAASLPSFSKSGPVIRRNINSTNSKNDNTGVNSLETVFRDQIRNPKDVLTVLLLIGGDTVQKAIAQLAGHKFFSPVAFSFGWVAYAFGALATVFGEGILMPASEVVSSVIDLKSTNTRLNESWLIGRLIRDLEKNVERELAKEVKDYNRDKQRCLVITVYETARGAGVSRTDRIWCTSCALIILQLFVSSIPWWLSKRNWSIFMITAVGTAAATFHATFIPQWKKEKYSCRERSRRDYIVTRGNGHKHVFVIVNGEIERVKRGEEKDKIYGISLNLEDLAITTPVPQLYTSFASLCLAAFWMLLLIIVSALEEDAWYLLGSGALGMVNNIFVATWERSTPGHGLPLKGKKKAQYGDGKMPNIDVLRLAEKRAAGLGLALRPIFFPGGFKDETERKEWDGYQETVTDRRQNSELQVSEHK